MGLGSLQASRYFLNSGTPFSDGTIKVWPEAMELPPARVSGIFSSTTTLASGSMSWASTAAAAPARPKPTITKSASSSQVSTV